MEDRDKEKLADIARRLHILNDELAELVQRIRQTEPAAERPDRDKPAADNFDSLVSELKAGGREMSSQKLAEWKQTELARLYKYLGGASRDRKKPKNWLIERILWQLFDFQSGHQLLRDRK